MGTEANLLAIAYSVEELEKMLRSALRDVAGGKTLTQWQVGDSSATKQAYMNLSPGTRAAIIGEALNIKDPVRYPIDSVMRITQTRPVYQYPLASSNGNI